MKISFVILIGILIIFSVIAGCSKQNQGITQKSQDIISEKELTASSAADCRKILPSVNTYCSDIGDAQVFFVGKGQTIELYPGETMSYEGDGLGACSWLVRTETEPIRTFSLNIDFFTAEQDAEEALAGHANRLNADVSDSSFLLEASASVEYPFNHRIDGAKISNTVVMITQFASEDSYFFCSSSQTALLLDSLMNFN